MSFNPTVGSASCVNVVSASVRRVNFRPVLDYRGHVDGQEARPGVQLIEPRTPKLFKVGQTTFGLWTVRRRAST